MRALLINDNRALGIDDNYPVYPPTIEEASRRSPEVESHSRGGNYVDSNRPFMYTSEQILRELQSSNPSQPITSLHRLACLCLMWSHNERCYATKDSNPKRDQVLSLKMYLVFRKLNVWPT